MTHLFILPIRLLLPLLVGAFALISVTASYFHTRHAVLDNIEVNGLRELRSNLNKAQGMLEILLRDERIPEAQRFIASFGADFKHSQMLLVNQQGLVIASTHLATVGNRWQSILPNIQQSQLDQLYESGGIQAFSDDHAVLRGYAGICKTTGNTSLRDTDCGFVFLEEQLNHQINDALAIVQTQAIRSGLSILFFTGLILLAVHTLVTNRLNKLLLITKQFASGNTKERVNLEGTDELARIGQSVDAMLDQIVTDKKQLLNQQQHLQDEVKKRTQHLTAEIAEHKATQQQFIAAKEYAEAANKAKTEFLSSMSHELRTPLNAIMGFSQLLDTDPDQPLSKTQQESINQILHSSKHLLTLIDQVLDLAKIEAGKINLTIEPFYPGAIITQALDTAKAIAPRFSVTVISELPNTKLPYIQGDEIRLYQILLNLLSNAIKYNKEGGTATLTCKTLAAEHMLRISISDSGSGIPGERQHELFEPFHRLGHEKLAIEGTGIGLTISKHLVELMNGKIDFESKAGVGSCFWVDLPLAEESDAADIQGSSSHKQSELKEADITNSSDNIQTVLYVEDNPANMALMKQLFNKLPTLSLITTQTAEEGLSIAEQELPQLILMDLNLPGMDGTTALKKLKQNKITAHIPVIAITADAMPSQVAQGIRAGFDCYLSKPFDIPELIATIQNAIKPKKES